MSTLMEHIERAERKRTWTMDDVVMIFEIRGIYDGWSAAELKDGRIVNRWAGTDYTRRAGATDAWIAEMIAEAA